MTASRSGTLVAGEVIKQEIRMRDSDANLPHQQSRTLTEQYLALHAELSSLHARSIPDMVAIDRKMAEIDAVHAKMKRRNSLPGDPQTY